MSKIKISEEYFEKYENDFKFDDSEFKTEQEVEVRIPFTGYYSLKVPCKNPQVAMAEVLKANRDIGVTSMTNVDMEIEDVPEEDTYSIVNK